MSRRYGSPARNHKLRPRRTIDTTASNASPSSPTDPSISANKLHDLDDHEDDNAKDEFTDDDLTLQDGAEYADTGEHRWNKIFLPLSCTKSVIEVSNEEFNAASENLLLAKAKLRESQEVLQSLIDRRGEDIQRKYTMMVRWSPNREQILVHSLLDEEGTDLIDSSSTRQDYVGVCEKHARVLAMCQRVERACLSFQMDRVPDSSGDEDCVRTESSISTKVGNNNSKASPLRDAHAALNGYTNGRSVICVVPVFSVARGIKSVPKSGLDPGTPPVCPLSAYLPQKLRCSLMTASLARGFGL